MATFKVKCKYYDAFFSKEYCEAVDSVFELLDELCFDYLAGDEIYDIQSSIKHKLEEINYIPYTLIQEICRFNNKYPDKEIYF